MGSDLILEATEDNFERAVARSRLPVVVDFWATWCGPCKTVAPMLETLAGHHAGAVRVAKVDVDRCPSLAATFGINSIPTLVVLHRGHELERHVGAAPMATLRALFDRAAAARRATS